jgi:hypothetical protein
MRVYHSATGKGVKEAGIEPEWYFTVALTRTEYDAIAANRIKTRGNNTGRVMNEVADTIGAMLSEAIADGVPRRCRVCGCTDDDCTQCIERTGEPCHWVEPDLCSACTEDTARHNVKRHKKGTR